MEENKQRSVVKSSDVTHPGLIRRASVLLILAFGLLGLLLFRILIYQTFGYDKYQQKVIDQMTTQSSVLAKRGNIYDKNGVLLATNVTTYRVFIAPASIAAVQREMDMQGEEIRLDAMISEKLADILSLSISSVLEQTTYTNKLDRTIKKNVDEDTADRIRALVDEYGWHRFVHLQATSARYYPYSTLASHALGFAGSDGTGLYGLEYQYNEYLAGTNGRYIIARDAQGNEMPYGYEEYIPAQDGYHLNSTIDVYVQSALEEQVKTAYIESEGKNRASGIVMDVNTGAILGMATYPSFDLNDPWALDMDSDIALQVSGIHPNSEEYSRVRQQLLLKMWSNKAITESYIPGSTFKVVTAAMALEEGVVSEETEFCCEGYKKVGGHTIHCHKTTGHKQLNFVRGIQQSCNPVLMTVGLSLGRETFYSYLKAFGYQEKTNVDLPGEGVGVFAAESVFTDLDLAIYAFGQNFNVTLIQQITAVSAVANGGYLVTPHFISSITDNDGKVIKAFDTNVKRQVVSAETCKRVSDILEKGVSGDGGAKNAYVPGYQIAAKTGTSEKKERECPRCDNVANIRQVNGENKFVCSICGHTGDSTEFPVSKDYVCSTVAYAPASNPKYAVIIIVDEPTAGSLYGSTVAAPYVAKVMETILPYLGVEAEYTEEELAKMAMKTPGYVGWSASAALANAKNRGIEVEIIGDEGGVVCKQYPPKDTQMEKENAKIILYTSKDEEVQTKTVPNVVGMTAKAANQTLINAGFNIRILGSKNYLSGTEAKVVAQSIEPGTEAPRGTVVEITLRYSEDEDYRVDIILE